MKGPEGLKATLNNKNQVVLQWITVPGATHYKIYEDQSPQGVSNGIVYEPYSVRGPFNIHRKMGYWVTAFVAGKETEPSYKQVFTYKPLTVETSQPVKKVIEWKDVIWAADFSQGQNNTECGFAKTQTQKKLKDKIATNKSVIPVINDRTLGKCLKFELPDYQTRIECNPNRNNQFDEGITYHSLAFKILKSFPSEVNHWQVIWQLHGNDNTSPRFSLQLRNNELRIGDSKGGWSPIIYYDAKYRIIIKADKLQGLMSVWVNGQWLIKDFKCGKSKTPYYQKSGLYHHDSLRGGTILQNGHAVGHTLESVQQFL